MKKYLPLIIVLGVLLLLCAGVGGVLATALVPLTIEAGSPTPAAADYARYDFLTPSGLVPEDTIHPRTHTFKLRVLGIPLTAELTVVDTVAPVLTAIPQTCFLGEELTIFDFVEVTEASAAELGYVTPPDFNRSGEQTVVVFAEDYAGNRAEVHVPLTVHAIAHTLTVEAGIAPDTLRGQITDAIEGDVAFDDDFADFDPARLGEQFITITQGGETVKLSLNVTDTTPPAGAPQVVSLLHGQRPEPADFLRKVDDATTVSVEFAAESDYTPGARPVSLRLTDAAGNTAEVAAVLRVYAAPAEATVELGTEMAAIEQLLLAGADVEFSSDAAAILAAPTLGEHKLTLVTPRGVELAQKVTFVDTTPPSAQVQNRTAFVGDTLAPADFVQNLTDATEVTAAYVGAAPDLSKPGSHTVSLTLTDAAGNAASLTASLTVIADTEPPVLYGVSDKTVYIGESVSYRSGVSAWDNRDGSVSVKANSSKVNLRVEGQYPVTYTAVDAAGNEASKTVTFTVRDVNTDAINEIADGILSKILRDGMTERERLRAIYDWSVANMRYTAYADKTDVVAAAYYGFRNGRGDCFVYYAVTRFLLTRAGVENLEIHRNIPEKPHFWNLVKFEGNWYHLDTCPHYAQHPLTCFLLTDAEVKAYSENHVADYYSFDASLYPATP